MERGKKGMHTLARRLDLNGFVCVYTCEFVHIEVP